ncbi:MAG TPA: PAS domain S-box protein [Thermoanaerobaculia bacterium]|nr:PAS domain S-box protein [Thermoanaerobaculia bacterium]
MNSHQGLAMGQQAETGLAQFFEQSFDLHCVAGLDGYFRRLNPAWVAALGWPLEELRSRPFAAFVHVDDREATLRETAKLCQGAGPLRFENRYACKDGSYRWLEWNARFVVDRDEIYATAREITGRKQFERETLEVLDREKERLGRELHDGLCQTLAGISALSSTLSRKLARLGAPASTADVQTAAADAAANAAAEIARLLNEAIGEARDMARGLGSVGLSEGGLETALATLALDVRHLFRASCAFACDRSLGRLDREAERHLFRIAQEAVNNAVAHGKARRIEIRLGAKGGEGLLTVLDNGVGMPQSPRPPDGIGMHNMAYRARLIGGRIEVRRRSRGGTTVLCAFPLSGTRKNP